MANEFGISLEDAHNELTYVVEEAHNFMTSEFSKSWEIGEAYYAGQSDLKTEKGRSSLVKTVVRDAIRSLMPNVMRVLLHARRPVVYTPNSIMTAKFADQQSHWATQLFYKEGGYRVLVDAILESFRMKAGPVKVYWEENTEPEHIYVTNISAAELVAYQEEPDIVVDEVTEREHPTSGDITYDMRATRYFENGRIRLEAFPIYEFFVQRNATNLEDFVHGHKRTVKVSEAIEMGLEYDDWRELGDDNPETNSAVGAAAIRRGYQPDGDNDHDVDIMNFEFLLTEAYCKYDLDGDGVPEKYVFYLGGNSHQLLHHERIEDFCIDLICHDPVPFTVIGRSIPDIAKQSQDSGTAVLRTIVDNGMIANNPRPAADPTRTNFEDLMNNGIGAPIRTKGSPDIKYAETPFTAGGMLPFLQYLDQDSQERIGITKAATGLDPDAMQSTDKDAVRNTIALSLGQVEYMVRNVIETGLIPIFKKLLRLSMRHMDRLQMIRLKGAVVPVDISRFDPHLVAEPTVGIGTAQPEQKLATLQMIYQEQKQYMMTMGMDNPFTSLSKMYNTLEDMIELGGLNNVGRYFNYVDERVEAIVAQKMKEQQAAQAEEQKQMQPIDPGRSLLMVESMKSRVSMQETMAKMRMHGMDLQHKALKDAEDADIRRDELVQSRVIELAKIGQDARNEAIKREQQSNSQRSTSRQGDKETGS